jgi:hypothetical protein
LRELSKIHKGYYDPTDISNCEQSGTTCYVPKVHDYAPAPDPRYDRKNFRYDAGNDCYICPDGQILPFNRLQKRAEGTADRRYQNFKICKNCPDRNKCTTNQAERIISRNPNQGALDTMNARMKPEAGREIFRHRKKIIEHPFGTTKAVWGFKQFLCRTREKATGEQSLAFLAYNFRRVFNIFRESGKSMAAAMV